MTLVVSDTSPIRALHFLGLLPILEDLYGPVVVPPAVERELSNPRPRFEPIDLVAFPFISVQSPGDFRRVHDFRAMLDLGESEALALAIEIQADVVLIDESKGRRVATLHGVPWLGTLAVLLEAKTQGRIVAIRPLVDQLTDELGFFISDALRQRVFHLAGET